MADSKHTVGDLRQLQALPLREALDAIETGMRRNRESRGIWQNELVYAQCQAVRLLLKEVRNVNLHLS